MATESVSVFTRAHQEVCRCALPEQRAGQTKASAWTAHGTEASAEATKRPGRTDHEKTPKPSARQGGSGEARRTADHEAPGGKAKPSAPPTGKQPQQAAYAARWCGARATEDSSRGGPAGSHELPPGTLGAF